MAEQSSFTDMLLTSLKDSLDQLMSDVSKGDVGRIYEQVTRGPTPLGKLPVRGAVQAVAPKLNDLLSLVMDMAKPGNTAKGIIGPVGNPNLKAIFEALRGKAPGLVKKAEGLSETLYPYLMPRELMPATGAVGAFRKSTTLPKGELYLRGGRPREEQIDTLGHELRHFLTAFDPSIAAKPAEQAAETAQQLAHMMPETQQAGMRNYLRSIGTPGEAGTPLELVKKTQGGTRRFSSLDKADDPELAFNEALSYLTEALMNPRGGDPALTAVAEALGQGIK